MPKGPIFSAPESAGNDADKTQAPLMGLLDLLRAEGFMVTTDDYVHLLKILERYGNEAPEALAYRICPIIATTPEEQKRFYPVLAQYFREQAAPVQQRRRQIPKWKKAVVAFLVVAGAAGFIYFFLKKPPITFPDGVQTLQVSKDSNFIFDLVQAGLLSGHLSDTAELQVAWEDSGRGPIGSGLRIQHRFSEPGLHLLRATVRNHKGKHPSVFRLQVQVCAGVVTTVITGAEVPQATKHGFVLHAHTLAPAAPDSFIWDTSALSSWGRFQVLNDSSILLQFDTPGIFSIRATPDRASRDGNCLQGGLATISIEDTTQQFEAQFRPGPPVILRTRLKPLVTWSGLFLLLAIAVIGFRPRGRKKTEPAPEKKDASSGTAALNPPWEVPFAAPAASDIFLSKSLRRFLQLLRFRTDEISLRPDIPASIRASIRQAGREELIFTPRKHIQSYLLFIDARAAQGIWHRLCLQLAHWMEAEGIPTTLFFYDTDFQCSATRDGARSNLRQIADNYPDSIPLIMGDGSALMHPSGGFCLPEQLEQLERWPAALLLTPLPRKDWSSRERLLAQHLLLAPADADALMRLAQDFKSGRKTRWEQVANTSATTLAGLKTTAAVKEYLGQDEALFQWLCACCIYPKPRWELLIAFGKVILARYGRSDALNYDTLLHLSRIPWLAAGSFPQRLRLTLLQELHPENEIAARRVLSDMLQKVQRQYKGAYLFRQEQDLQTSLNGFVLYAHNPVQFSAFEGQATHFQTLLEAGSVSDVPARKYLEGGSWETPIQSQGSTIGLAQFLEKKKAQKQAVETSEATRQRRKRNLRRFVSLAAMLAVAGSWMLLQGSTAVPRQSLFAGWYHVDSGAMIPLRFEVNADFSACGDSLKKLRVLPATLQANDKPYCMAFDASSQSLSAQIPYRELASVSTLTLGISGSSQLLSVPIEAVSSQGVLSLSCRNGISVPVAAGADSLPFFLNEIWSGSGNQRLLNINLSQGMVWYSTGGPDTWGSYRIDTVLTRGTSGIGKRYQVVLRAYPGYAVLFIGNPTEQGFNLAFCPQRWQSRMEALNAGNDCGTPDAMRLYYRNDRPQLILLPVTRPDGTNPALRFQEAEKIPRLLGTQNMQLPALILLRYTNRKFLNMRDFSSQEVQDLFQGRYAFDRIIRKKQAVADVPNPFQREALRLSLNPNSVTMPAPNLNKQKGNLPNSYPKLPKADSNPTTPEKNGNSEDLSVRFQKATELLRSGDEKEGISMLQQIIRTGQAGNPWRVSSYIQLADFYTQQGDRNQASRLLEQALKESNNKEQIGEIRSRLGQLSPKKQSKY